MRALRLCVLGSSTAAGTNLSSPTTERWPAHYSNYLAAARPGSTLALVARANLNTYHAQATGTTPPGGRDSPDTSFNITAALATFPDVVIVNINSDWVDAHDNWGITDFTTPGTGWVDVELIPNLQAIAAVGAAAGVQVWFTDGQPVDRGWGGAAVTQPEIDARTYGKNRVAAVFPTRFVPFWAVLDDGAGTLNDSYLNGIDFVHPNSTATPLLSDAVEGTTLLAQNDATAMTTPLDIVSSVTSLAFWDFEDANVTESAGKVTAVEDLTANNYDLVEGAAGVGGVWEATGMRGRPSILFNGTTEYLKNTGTLGNTMVGGIDNSCFFMCAFQLLVTTSGQNLFSCGDNASANPFYRIVVEVGPLWAGRKRDAATAGGGGTGAAGGTPDTNPHYIEFQHDGTTFDLRLDGVSIASGGMDVGDMGTLDQFALACNFRTTAAGFANARISAPYCANGVPNGTELTNLRAWYARFTTDPVVDVTAASSTATGQTIDAGIATPVDVVTATATGQDVALVYYNVAVDAATATATGQNIVLNYSGAPPEDDVGATSGMRGRRLRFVRR